MRKNLIRLVLVAGIEVAGMMLLQGCKRHTAPPPVQPVVRSIPKMAQPDIPGPLPVEGADQAPMERRASPRRHARTEEVQPQPVDAQAAEATQQRRDARLLRQQQATSQAQQRELNGEVERSAKARQQVQDEPRIQDAPEPPASSGLGPDAPRIQDAPGPDQGQPGQEPPRIQDAPGPAQTQPQPQPQMR